VSGADLRPDRHALLELDALLSEIIAVRDEGDGERFDRDRRHRRLLHRLWIAICNEALAYTAAIGRPVRGAQPWANLYELRNHLAHHRLPDVDDGRVRRITWLSTDQLRTQVQHLLRTTG